MGAHHHSGRGDTPDHDHTRGMGRWGPSPHHPYHGTNVIMHIIIVISNNININVSISVRNYC